MARQRNIYASLKYLQARFSGNMPIVPEYSFDNNKQLQVRNAANTADVPLIGNDASDITQLGNPNGVNALAFSTTQLATPGTPVVTVVGTAGSTTWAYKIVAKSGNGSTLGVTAASAAGQTTTGNATLSTTNYNTITWAAVAGAASYDIYRTTAAGTPSSTGKIGNLAAQIISETTIAPTFNDTGLTGDSATAPTVNTTGGLVTAGAVGTTAINDSNGNKIIGLNAAASAVNWLVVSNRGTGAAPVISVDGEAGVGLQITTKSTSAMSFQTNGTALGGTNQFQVKDTASAINYLTVAGGATTAAPVIGIGTTTDSNVSVVVTPKGSGGLCTGTSPGQFGPLSHVMSDFAIATSNTALTAAQMIDGIIRVTAGTNTNATDTAANIVAAIPNCQVGSTFLMTVINGSGNAETLTLGSGVTAASGVTVTLTIATATCKQYLFRVTNVGTPAVTIYEIGASTL